MLALFEEGVDARALPEVEVLPRLAAGGGTGGDYSAVDQDFDGADVPREAVSPASL